MAGVILVTGGAGYIGSHCLIELHKADKEFIVIDNFHNASKKCIERVEKIIEKKIKIYDMDLKDEEKLRKVFDENVISGVIHFAALKAVGESISMPISYYQNNVGGTLSLIKMMQEFSVKKMVFSSSATVYTADNISPLSEDSKVGVSTNPYGTSKFMCEVILQDLVKSDKEWSVVLLRYFNPVGAHKSGEIGEDPKGEPKNLMPYVSKVAMGVLPELSVFGNDYDTEDGTGVRDYIHVVDLCEAHVKALDKLEETGVCIYNLGTGKGTSVLELVSAMEKASGAKIPYAIRDRRPGDLATVFCDPAKANKQLKWAAKRTIEDMCEDSWRWQKKNKYGFESQ